MLGYDLIVADSAAPAVFGLDEQLSASGRLENLSSVHSGFTARLPLAADADADTDDERARAIASSWSALRD